MENGQLTPTKTSEILKLLGHEPNKKLGQNFLTDSNIVRKSLELADVKEGDIVVEVGPGLGTLTGALLERGAKVFAVELDRNLFEYMQKEFGDNPNLNLLRGDAVKFPLASLDTSKYPNFKIVANLPYSISTPWLDAVLSSGTLPESMTLMLQREAAARFAAKGDSREYSPISIFLGESYVVSGRKNVAAGCFHPRPAVDSVLLSLAKKSDAYVFRKETKSLIRKIFSKRRKQLGSIAKSYSADREIIEKWLDLNAEVLPRTARPETVTPELWKKLDAVVNSALSAGAVVAKETEAE